MLAAAPSWESLAAVKNGKWQDMLVMAAGNHRSDDPVLCYRVSSDLCISPIKLNWLPTFGLDSWKGYLLPVIALGGYSVSYMARLMRSSLLEVMGQDYIRTATGERACQRQSVILQACHCEMP